jgi:citrate lyase subunit beta/citryl-CoA lyase
MSAAVRSLLFVPGDSPRKMEKGMTSGADALIVDLEDSVGANGKAAARGTASAFLKEALAQATRPRIYVRVNALDTGLTDDDLDAVVGAKPDGILLPKAEGGAAVTHLDAKLTAREAINGMPDGKIDIYVLATETAKALFLAGTYANSSARLKGITWGAEDLSAELGGEANRDAQGNFLDPYRLARSLCLAGAAAAGVPALDTVYVDFKNDAGLRRECEDARRDGFAGKIAIHPGQIPIINEVFTPSAEQIGRAKKIVAAFAAQPGAGTVGIDGKMYDRPHLAIAKRLLERAGER